MNILIHKHEIVFSKDTVTWRVFFVETGSGFYLMYMNDGEETKKAPLLLMPVDIERVIEKLGILSVDTINSFEFFCMAALGAASITMKYNS